MNNRELNIKNVELFEEMRRGEWSREEVQSILQDRGDTGALQESYQDYLNIAEGVQQYERERLKDFLLSDTSPEKRTLRAIVFSNFSRTVGIAASLLLILSFTYTFFLFDQHVYQTYSLSERTGTELGGETNPQLTEQAIYLAAIRQQAAGDFEAAKVGFEQIEMEALWTRARYNLALIHIKHKNHLQAKAELEAIIIKDSQSILAKQAAELLEVLNAPRLYFLFQF